MNQVVEIIKQGREIEYDFPPLARLGKLFEECGEFSETVVHNQGFLPHKSPKESPFGEAADVFICLIDTLASLYPESTPELISLCFIEAVETKRDKWQKVVIDPGNSRSRNT